MGIDVGGLLKKGLERGVEEARKRIGVNPTGGFNRASGADAGAEPEAKESFIVSNTVPGVKGKGGKVGPASTDYYRVEGTDNGYTAKKLEKAEITSAVTQSAKSRNQLDAEVKAANSPAALAESIARASRADELIGKAKNPKYDRPEATDNKLNAMVQNGQYAQARDAIMEDLQKTAGKLDDLSDKKMPAGQKETLGQTIESDLDKLQRQQVATQVSSAVNQAINPAAAAPKVDPLAAPKVDPLAP